MATNGTVGDVKFSVLAPDKFKTENGDGWRLLDGSNISNTELEGLIDSVTLPDARGMFIRGMNVGGGQDPDNRKMGDPQSDSIKDHTHAITTRSFVDQLSAGICGSSSNATAHGSTGSNDGASTETRPKNIALYIYIKVSRR